MGVILSTYKSWDDPPVAAMGSFYIFGHIKGWPAMESRINIKSGQIIATSHGSLRPQNEADFREMGPLQGNLAW